MADCWHRLRRQLSVSQNQLCARLHTLRAACSAASDLRPVVVPPCTAIRAVRSSSLDARRFLPARFRCSSSSSRQAPP